jgi:Putative F0F1-ATPase subunit Ca2+/Mg2+ transporter
MEKPEEKSESENSLDKVRAAKQAYREHEIGYKTGKSLGKQLRSSHLLMLPIQMALAPVLATLAGRWIDGQLETSPGFTLGGLAFGLAVAALSLVRSLKEEQD